MDRKINVNQLRRERFRKGIKWGVVILLVVMLFWLLITLFKTSVAREDLKCSIVDRGDISLSIQASGIAKPLYEQTLVSSIASQILKVYARSGDPLQSGDTVLQLDAQQVAHDYENMLDKKRVLHTQLEELLVNNETRISELDMKITVAQKKLNCMHVELKNAQYLDSLGVGTQDKIRQASLNVSVAELELQQMQQRVVNEKRIANAQEQVKQLEYAIHSKNVAEKKRILDDATLTAPRACMLVSVNHEVGVSIAQGQRLATIADLSHYKIEAEVVDAYANRLIVGNKALLNLGKQSIEAIVTRVEPQSKSGMVHFSLTLAEKKEQLLRSGLKMTCYVFYADRHDVLRIALGSYYRGPGSYEIFVQEKNNLIRRRIELGEANYAYVEVLKGLYEGENVVVSDMDSYKDKEKIKLK